MNDVGEDVTTRLADLQYQLHSIVLEYVFSRAVRKNVLDLIKRYNSVLPELAKSDAAVRNSVRAQCDRLLKLYDHVKSDNARFMGLDERILWTASKVSQGEIYFPFDEELGVFVGSKHEPTERGLWYGAEIDTGDVEGLDELFQDGLANCSFVASMLAVARTPGGVETLRGLLKANSNRDNFVVLLKFNGGTRIVEVDNYLPRESRFHVKSCTNASLLWPAVVENAVLRVQGASNFDSLSGSNFAEDSFVLAGFLPDYFAVNELTKDQVEHIYEDVCSGKVVVGLGTAALTSNECSAYKLAPNHDYYVAEMHRDPAAQHGFRFSLVNSWLKDRVIEAVDLYPFHTLYVCWRPDNCGFEHSTTRHFVVNNRRDGVSKGLLEHIQFAVSSTETTEVFVLLERHIDRAAKRVKLRAEWFETPNGEKVWARQTRYPLILATVQNESRFSLTKLTLKKGQTATGVFLVESDDETAAVCSVYFYSRAEINVRRAVYEFPHTKELGDSWTPMSAGGSWANKEFLENPQYEIKVSRETVVNVGLFSESKLPVNVAIVENEDERFRFITKFRGSVGQNTRYSEGMQVSRVVLEPGKRYVAIVSTYSPGDCGRFRLVTNSEAEISVERVSTRLGVYVRRHEQKFVGDSLVTRFHLPRNSARVMMKIDVSLPVVATLQRVGGGVVDSTGREVRRYLHGLYLTGQNVSSGEYEVVVRGESEGEVVGMVEIGTSIMTNDERSES